MDSQHLSRYCIHLSIRLIGQFFDFVKQKRRNLWSLLVDLVEEVIEVEIDKHFQHGFFHFACSQMYGYPVALSRVREVYSH